jgi:serine/threonine-protein kinase GIN4
LKVQAGNFEMPEEISSEAQSLIAQMLTADPVKRISTEKILKHPLLNKYPIPNEDLISVKSLPHPETAYKSLGSEKNIDKQILANLSILWNDRSQQDIINCLLQPGSNPETTFYALLLRYRHNQDEVCSVTKKPGVPRSTSSSSKHTPRKKRSSQINVSRPTSFQYNAARNTRNSIINTGKGSGSVHNSPSKRFSYSQSPVRSPYRSPKKSRQENQQYGDQSPPPIPRNIYNEIVQAQRNGSQYSVQQSLPPSLPSKDSNLQSRNPKYPSPDRGLVQQPPQAYQQHYYQQQQQVQNNQNSYAPQSQHAGKENPIVDEVSSEKLLAPANVSPDKVTKRNSIMKTSTSKNRLSYRKSIRASMTTGLKRNSITMKLLSTYAKLSGETDWEYMDKSAKRTSANFATLCDKIFSHEEYNEEDERLLDEDEIRAKEYERLMEIERKKHEAELLARRELDKRRRREKRRSLLSSRKLSILIKDDNNSESEITAEQIDQPKRQSKLRTVSEGANSESLTGEDLEKLKKRAVTAPQATRRQTPILTRRPISRLDPLWMAQENEELKAQEALDAELLEPEGKKSSTGKSKSRKDSAIEDNDLGRDTKYRNRESFVTDGHSITKRMSRDSYYLKDDQFELPEPKVDDSKLTDEYLSEIRKSRLLNSQNNLNVDNTKYGEKKTLIANVNIPKVTRKSRCFTNSNKRLSVLSMYSTKQSYHDLNNFLDGPNDPRSQVDDQQTALRTSFADRLDNHNLATVDDEDEPLEEASILDFDDHVDNRRNSEYGPRNRHSARKPTTLLPDLPNKATDSNANVEADADDTFVTKNDEVRKQVNQDRGLYDDIIDDESEDENTNVFDTIKLPDGKSNTSAATAGTSKSTHKSMMPESNGAKSQPIPKVRKQQNTNTAVPKKPLIDATNTSDAPVQEKRSRSIFRKLSWGSKKTLEDPVNTQLPTPAGSRVASAEPKPKSGFFRWFSSSHDRIENDIKRFNTILPKHEMSTALFALLKSWQSFGVKDIKNDQMTYTITGSISSDNSFNMKGTKFRIKINSRDRNQRSEIVCARVKGSSNTANTLFGEIEKVLLKEGVLDK